MGVTTRTAANFWLDLVSLLVMIGLAATGGLIHFVLPAGTGHSLDLFGWNRHDLGHVHFYLAVAAMGLLAFHLGLHWKWIGCVAARMAGRGTPSRKRRTAWGVSVLLGIIVLLVGGLLWASTMVREMAPEDGERAHRYRAEISPQLP